MLYLPRGTIHQAAAQGVHSSHLTISTYQRWSAADLLQVRGGGGVGARACVRAMQAYRASCPGRFCETPAEHLPSHPTPCPTPHPLSSTLCLWR